MLGAVNLFTKVTRAKDELGRGAAGTLCLLVELTARLPGCHGDDENSNGQRGSR